MIQAGVAQMDIVLGLAGVARLDPLLSFGWNSKDQRGRCIAGLYWLGVSAAFCSIPTNLELHWELLGFAELEMRTDNAVVSG